MGSSDRVVKLVGINIHKAEPATFHDTPF